jgi:hypothetical protein
MVQFAHLPTPKPTFKRFKRKQKNIGAITEKVREEVHVNSDGLCQVREKCNGKKAAEQAHMRGRRIIKETNSHWVLNACVECHRWLDNTGPGAVWKREYRKKLLNLEELK